MSRIIFTGCVTGLLTWAILVTSGGQLRDSIRCKVDSKENLEPPSVLLHDLLQKKEKLEKTEGILGQALKKTTAELEEQNVYSSKDLKNPSTRLKAKEFAEIVIQQNTIKKQISEVQRLLDEVVYLRRRLNREELMNDNGLSNEEVRKQLGELTELLTKLDSKFKNLGTVSTQDAVDKIIDEQLKK